MTARRITPGVALLLVIALSPACDSFSCSPQPESIIPPVASAGASTSRFTIASTSTTAAPNPITTTLPTTTTAASTTSTPTTSTTLDPLEAYKAEMRAWKNRYAADLETSYAVISSMRDPLSPSRQEVQAAEDLDALLADMTADLERIQPPPELASTHAEYLGSLQDLAEGAHKLADAMEDGSALRTMSAITSIATAWARGEPERTAMEQALGFSLSQTD